VSSLFDAPPEAGPPTYTVGELGTAIEQTLHDGFRGGVWVRGEVSGLRAPGHVYFDLCDPGHAVKVPVVLYARAARQIDQQLADAGLVLTDGVELRIRAEVGFYTPQGRLQLRMTAVDPAFTVGQLALSRERLLAALRADGTLARNGTLPVVDVPLRIGLVTSRGTAAWNDFVEELAAAACAFELVAADARVSGPECPASVLDALRRLYRLHRHAPLDLVAIVRGGGSRTDLAGFDDERIARAIASMQVPVWTGIGHEIDTSVADHAAHRSFKTPTAVAAELRGRAERGVAEVGERSRRLHAAVIGTLSLQAEQLDARRHRVRRATQTLLAAERSRLIVAGERLPRAVRQTLDAHGAHLASAARHLDALDPARVLARGFSVTRTLDGRAVTAAGELAAGDLLVTQLADGEVTSRVTATMEEQA
jgi:exodeoxyribonuclease VII large subunit